MTFSNAIDPAEILLKFLTKKVRQRERFEHDYRQNHPVHNPDINQPATADSSRF